MGPLIHSYFSDPDEIVIFYRLFPCKLIVAPKSRPFAVRSTRTLPPVRGLAASFYVRECVMRSEEVAPPLAANMNAAFKKVRGAIGATDPALRELIVARIVELAKDGVYDIEELSSRTLSSLKQAG